MQNCDDVLQHRLEARNGITDEALQWISSYLTSLSPSVQTAGHASSSAPLRCGVPQGSVLGLDFFIDYISPVEDLIHECGMAMHGYADDTKIYAAFTPGDDEERIRTELETCINKVRTWMNSNKLKLNDSKMEFIIMGTKKSLEKVETLSIKIGDENISLSSLNFSLAQVKI